MTERLPRHFTGRISLSKVEQEVLQLVYNPQRLGSVRELVLRLRQIASMVRDRLSADTWRILNQLQTDAKTRAGRLPLANALTVCNTLIVDLAAFSGMEMENMTRGHGWRFLDFGRRLERAYNLVDSIRAALAVTNGSNALLSLLEIADSTITYRRRYFSEPRLVSVLDLLLADPGNPRALAFQLNALREHARELPKSQEHASGILLQRVNALISKSGEFLLSELETSHPEKLKALLVALASELTTLSDDLSEHYFCHVVAQRVETQP